MSKVSIGLRGWRFDEDDVFEPDGTYRPLDAMPADVRERVVRLAALVGEPCHACWLEHGDAAVEACAVGTVVYGEPEAEVLLCDEHETDFVYWFREAGGRAHRGDPALREAFHDWFEAGDRAPEGYGGIEHVDTDPEDLPAPPVENASCDVVVGDAEGAESDDDPSDDPPATDLSREYPRADQ